VTARGLLVFLPINRFPASVRGIFSVPTNSPDRAVTGEFYDFAGRFKHIPQVGRVRSSCHINNLVICKNMMPAKRITDSALFHKVYSSSKDFSKLFLCLHVVEKSPVRIVTKHHEHIHINYPGGSLSPSPLSRQKRGLYLV